MKKQIVTVVLSLFALSATAQNNIDITVNCGNIVGEMNPLWAWFGYDEPNYTYMKDGKKLLTEISKLSPVPVYVRAHSLMCTGDGTPALKWGSTDMYREDESGNPIYSWEIIDKIFDTYVERGMKPLAQMGFMPQALSRKPIPYQHTWVPGRPYGEIYTGWTSPPTSYEKWAELIYQWVKHSVERYGKDEVLSWYWELWNEPDSPYFDGTVEEYSKLYDYSVDAIQRALPGARVGGPHVTGPGGSRGAKFLRAFLDHCAAGTNYVTGAKGTKIDFIAFHAKGSPRVENGHVTMSIGRQLNDIDKGCEIVASYDAFKNLPIIIGESDPEGCAACGMHTNPENAYRNGTMYSSYTAASFARKYAIADRRGVNILGAVSWSFEFEDQPWFYGFRDLATNGVDKPVLNVFRMFGKMSGNRVEVGGGSGYDYETIIRAGVRKQDDVNAIASVSQNSVAVMVWNYHDEDLPAPAAQVKLVVNNIPVEKATLRHYRIDASHSNSYEVWKGMGSPQSPTRKQISQLEKSGKLEEFSPARKLRIAGNSDTQEFSLPRQGVSLLLYTW